MNWQHVSDQMIRKMKESNLYIKGLMFFGGLDLTLSGLMLIYKGITKYSNNFDDVIGIIIGILLIIISALLLIASLGMNKKTLYKCDIDDIYFSSDAEFLNPRKLEKSRSSDYVCDIRITEPETMNISKRHDNIKKIFNARRLSRKEYENIAESPPTVFAGYKDNKFTFIGTESLVYTSAAAKITYLIIMLFTDMIVISLPLIGKLTLGFRFLASITALASILFFAALIIKSCLEQFKSALVITAAAGLIIAYCIPVRNILSCVSDYKIGTTQVITQDYDLSISRSKNSKSYRVTLYDGDRKLRYVISKSTYKKLKNAPYSELTVSYYKNTGLCSSFEIS